ncbi:heterodisulfide reductase-related iron-sulfur binding cluster, partial [Fluviispira multicolorata]
MQEKKVFLFPSCASKLLDKKNNDSMLDKIKSILNKLNYEIKMLNFPNECCGLMYHSMGVKKVAEKKIKQFFQKIMEASENSKHPILIENSSCFLEI